MPPSQRARLELEDGTLFEGFSFGACRSTSGEVVFTTGMVGYPQSLTDPSFKGQLLVLTYPLAGNYGVPAKEDQQAFESDYIQIKGLIVADYTPHYDHWSAARSLGQWLYEENVPGITGIDTRQLTKHLRTKGAMLGKIIIGDSVLDSFYDPNKENLVAAASCTTTSTFGSGNKHVALIDCGSKRSIIRELVKRQVKVTLVPWNYDVMDLSIDGLMISNGPGDPAMVALTIENVRAFMKTERPIWGICMGNQILALAAGGKTYKLKFGHRGQNQPCKECGTKRCIITSQNHGFAVDVKSLPPDWEEWFVNANDGSNEGIRHKTKPFRSVQFHPEACPGPTDANYLFDEFVRQL